MDNTLGSVEFDEPDQFGRLLDVVVTGLYPCCLLYLHEVDYPELVFDDCENPIIDLLSMQIIFEGCE